MGSVGIDFRFYSYQLLKKKNGDMNDSLSLSFSLPFAEI